MNVVITGASRGIGKAIAEKFAAEGATLFLCSRNENLLNKTVANLGFAHPAIQIYSMAADLSLKEKAIEFGEWVLNQAIPDILINNAGHFLPGNVSNEKEGNLECQIATNLSSAYHLTRTVLHKMKEKKKGQIFTICSIASLQAYPNGGSYSISKFALEGFTKNLRQELLSFNIKVTAVYPGAVLTDSWGDFDNSHNRIMLSSDIAMMIWSASQLSPGACVEEIVMRPQQGDL